jgi:uncharacterized protein (TIGR02246 family)
MSDAISLRDDLQALLDRWVEQYARGDLEAAVACYAADGAIYSPYGPAAVGHEAIRNTHADWLAEGEINKRIVVLEARGDGDVAYCVATYSGDVPQPDGSRTREAGTSLNVCVRDAAGDWIVQVSSLNRDWPLSDDPCTPGKDR